MAGSDSLNGKAISDTYKDLLQVPNANSGVDGTLRTVMDGEGTESTLQVSTAGVKSTGTLESTGNLTVGGTLTLGGTAISSLEDGATADQTGAEIKTAYEGEADTNAFTDADHTKLDGIEANATANDTDANLKNRANHTGTQAASTISDFDTEVANNTAVAANTAKVTNATHTGDVTGDTALTIANDAVTTAKIADDAVTAAKLNAALNDLSNVNASPSDGQVLKWVNASSEWQAADDTSGTTYSDFTGATSSTDGTAGLVPQPDSGDEGKYLKGDGTWDTVSGSGGGEANQNAFSTVAVSGQDNVEADSSTDTLNLAAGSNVTITTTAASDTVTIAATDTNTTYSNFVGDDGLGDGSGTAGLVPAPADGTAAAGKFLKADGTWATPPDTDTDTTYSVVTSSADGLAPQLPASAAGKFLKADGTWEVPPDTTYTFGIANTNAVQIDSDDVADDEYARFTANGLESLSASEVLSDIGAAASAHAHSAYAEKASSNTWTAAQQGNTQTAAFSTLSSGVLDFDTYQNFVITLGAGTNAFTNPTTDSGNTGQTGVIVLIQDSSASTATWASDYKNVGGSAPTLSSGSAKVDVLPYIIQADNTILLGAPQLDFS